jgi:hypothetical protein
MATLPHRPPAQHNDFADAPIGGPNADVLGAATSTRDGYAADPPVSPALPKAALAKAVETQQRRDRPVAFTQAPPVAAIPPAEAAKRQQTGAEHRANRAIKVAPGRVQAHAEDHTGLNADFAGNVVAAAPVEAAVAASEDKPVAAAPMDVPAATAPALFTPPPQMRRPPPFRPFEAPATRPDHKQNGTAAFVPAPDHQPAPYAPVSRRFDAGPSLIRTRAAPSPVVPDALPSLPPPARQTATGAGAVTVSIDRLELRAAPAAHPPRSVTPARRIGLDEYTTRRTPAGMP